MYAKNLTKDYLIKLGVTNITPDGKHIFINNNEVTQFKVQSGYLAINAYDHDIYNAIYPITKCKSAGTVLVLMHRAVYAWYNNSIDENMVVDHINNNKTDNRIENLQLLTPKQNIWKGRECDVWEMKCNLARPRSFYERKLENYEWEYGIAKLQKDAKKIHKLRANISQSRARLRYWDSHHKC